MPGQIELRLGGFAETGNIEFSEHFLQRHTVQPVQVGPGESTVTHFVHEGPILSAPGIGKSVPVGRHSMDSAKLFAVLDDATAPVDHCAEHIKDQCLHVSDVHHHAPQCAYANSGGDASRPVASLQPPTIPLPAAHVQLRGAGGSNCKFDL